MRNRSIEQACATCSQRDPPLGKITSNHDRITRSVQAFGMLGGLHSPLWFPTQTLISPPILLQVLAESGAIVEYLCDHFAQHLVPKRYREGHEGQVGGESESWIRYRFYMHYAEGSLMTLLIVALFMDRRHQVLFTRCIPLADTVTRDQKYADLVLHQASYPRHRSEGGQAVSHRKFQDSLWVS